jgi:hypothetical protein
MPPRKATRTHGLTKTRTYRVWQNMLTRCRNPNYKDASRYSLRGITVCDAWLSFESFLADMGTCPSDSHTIDRIDNDGNYEPGNCRWGTHSENCRNRSNNRLLALNGVSKPAVSWAE